MFILFDLFLFFGLLALIFYILILTAVLPASLGDLSYIFLIIAIVLFCVWVLFRFIGECSGGRYRMRNRNHLV